MRSVRWFVRPRASALTLPPTPQRLSEKEQSQSAPTAAWPAEAKSKKIRERRAVYARRHPKGRAKTSAQAILRKATPGRSIATPLTTAQLCRHREGAGHQRGQRTSLLRESDGRPRAD